MAVYWAKRDTILWTIISKKHLWQQNLYKLSLNGGMTCPNRDGTCGTRGCIFWQPGLVLVILPNHLPRRFVNRLNMENSKVAAKYGGGSYIAYFQAYTNTYAPVDYLRKIFTEAIMHPDIRILSVANKTGLPR